MMQEPFLSVDGKNHTLASAKGNKGLLVMFSCNTCPYVVKSQDRTKEMIGFAKENEIGMVIVNSNALQREDADSYNAMKKYSENQSYTVPYLVDKGGLAKAFGATRTPEVFLFDGNGKLVYRGAMEDNPIEPAASQHQYLRDAIERMVAGKSPEPGTTKSIGCSIKIKS